MSLSVQFQHRFPNLTLDIAFEAVRSGVTVLFGPSGCGKSTVLSAVAGMLRPDSGHIVVEGTNLFDSAAGLYLVPERRRVGVVFQNARLFPHMTVLSNLRFGQRRAPPGPIRLDEVIGLLGIEPLLKRRSPTLSGGERQRVAIGRALLSQPRLLAMDEPLASLDGKRKAEILPFLIRLKTSLALPILYVTHSQEELASLADTLVLIDAGQVIAAGPVDEIVSRGDLPTAKRDDAGAVLAVRVAKHDVTLGLTTIDCNGTHFFVPLLDAAPETRMRVRVPAREVILATERPGASSVHNVLEGQVRQITPDPEHRAVMVEVQLPGARLLARITPDAVDRLHLAAGASVLALVKSVSIEILPR